MGTSEREKLEAIVGLPRLAGTLARAWAGHCNDALSIYRYSKFKRNGLDNKQ